MTEFKLIDLYHKAGSGELSLDEVRFVEKQTSQYPAFPLPWMILARHHFVSHSTIRDSMLKKASAYAPDLTLLYNYVEGKTEEEDLQQMLAANLDAFLSGDAEAEDQGAEKQKPEDKKPEILEDKSVPAVHKPEKEDKGISEVVVPDSVPEDMEADLGDEDEITSKPETREKAKEVEQPQKITPENQAADEETELDEVLPEKREDQPSVTDESTSEERGDISKVRIEDSVPEDFDSDEGEGETETPQTEKKSGESEEKKETSSKAGINWGLNMKINIRVTQFTGMSERILKEIRENLEREKSAGTAGEIAGSEKDEAADQQEESGPGFEIDFAKLKDAEDTPEGKKNAKEAEPEVFESDVDYQIGSMSGFSFLDESITQEVIEKELPADLQEEKDEDAGDASADHITLEERDKNRIVEISVSPEQLSKYFKNRKKPEQDEKKNLKKESIRKKDKSKTKDIIDKFIETEPTISRGGEKEISGENLAKDSSRSPDDLVSETLAKIHLNQGNLQKAVRIYEKLIRLHPENEKYYREQILKIRKN